MPHRYDAPELRRARRGSPSLFLRLLALAVPLGVVVTVVHFAPQAPHRVVPRRERVQVSDATAQKGTYGWWLGGAPDAGQEVTESEADEGTESVVAEDMVKRECGDEGIAALSYTKPQFKMCVHAQPDVISSFILQDGYWRDCRHLPSMLRKATQGHGCGVVVDVGANIGSCSLHLASQCASVFAFEPLSANFNLLKRAVELNGFQDRVFPHNIALGSGNATKTIFWEVGNLGNSIITDSDHIAANRDWDNTFFRKEEVQVGRLDDYVKQHVALLKLDCQGYELQVLRGAVKLLTHHKVDLIRSEVDPRLMDAVGDSPSELFRFLFDAGYDVFVTDSAFDFEGPQEGRWLRPSEYEKYESRLRKANTPTHINATRTEETRKVVLSMYSVIDGSERSPSPSPALTGENSNLA